MGNKKELSMTFSCKGGPPLEFRFLWMSRCCDVFLTLLGWIAKVLLLAPILPFAFVYCILFKQPKEVRFTPIPEYTFEDLRKGKKPY